MCVAAILKARGYRSFCNYLSDVKDEHIRAVHLWTERLAQEEHSVGHAGRGSTEAVAAIALPGALRTSAWYSARVT